jgi:putative PIN family toxin of toxin-antitoxin system
VRVLLDTNVLVAAFISRGQCSELFEHAGSEHELVTSEVVLRELRRALLEKLEFPEAEVIEAVELVRLRSRSVEPTPLGQSVSRDPDDDRILATAVAGECQCLVTGDEDLLVLESYEGIRILRPADFWAFETRWEGEG